MQSKLPLSDCPASHLLGEAHWNIWHLSLRKIPFCLKVYRHSELLQGIRRHSPLSPNGCKESYVLRPLETVDSVQRVRKVPSRTSLIIDVSALERGSQVVIWPNHGISGRQFFLIRPRWLRTTFLTSSLCQDVWLSVGRWWFDHSFKSLSARHVEFAFSNVICVLSAAKLSLIYTN